MLRITNRTVFFAASSAPSAKLANLAYLATVLLSLAVMTGCAPKVEMQPQANFLQNGTYRSKVEAAPGKMTGLYLQLNGNGRFSMATLDGGCFLSEDWGVWSATQEELSLTVQKSRSRESCGSAWESVQHEIAFNCSMRNVTDRSFQMLHEEIQHGTLWTAWERETAQGYAELERLRKEPGNETVTLDASPDSDERREKSAPGEVPADVIQQP